MTEKTPSQDRYARVHGSAGEDPRLRGLVLMILPILVVMTAMGYLVRAALPWPPLGRTWVGALLLALGVAFAVAVRACRTRLDSFIKGARGEEGVGRVLALLPSSFDVFHGLAASGRSGGDFDHVVVGPRGVFLVETKNWAGAVRLEDGRVLVDGREPDRSPLDQAGRAADDLRAFLRSACEAPVPVLPILCFTSPQTPIRTQGAGGVLICSDRHLLDVIQEHAEDDLPPARQARVVAALRKRLG